MLRVCLGFVLLLCCSLQPLGAERKLKVLATFLPAYSFAANVAGEKAQVDCLISGGVSLHDYQLTPGDLGKITAADLIVINGLGMERFLDRAIQNSGPQTKAKLVTMTDGLEGKLMRRDPEAAGQGASSSDVYDPHVWLDPTLAAHCVTNIIRALQKADPGNASFYAANGATYIAKLHRLDDDLRKQLAGIKEAPLITYHSAFRYFVRRYGLNLAGVVEQVPEIPPSPRELAALYQTIREKKVKAIFTDPSSSARLAQQIAKDTGARLGVLDPIETGELNRESYSDRMRQNAAALTAALK